MSSRSIQLGDKLCDQDQLIIDLFKDEPVCYVGDDAEFAAKLNCIESSPNLILILNSKLWCSDIQKKCALHLTSNVNKFYISINRYKILGNNTNFTFENSNVPGNDIIKMLEYFIKPLGVSVTRSGTHDFDRGRYFNFIQPLTWIYGTKNTNQDN